LTTYKFCEKKFNIKTCNTLRLGTFEYYSKLDPSFSIADADEGWMNINGFSKTNGIHGDTVISCTENPRGVIGRVHVEVTGEGNQILSVRPRLRFRNCYIYCMSTLNSDEVPNPKDVDPSYDDYFSLDEQRISAFISNVASLLLQQIRFEDLALDQIGHPSISQLMETPIQLTYQTEHVTYSDARDTSITELIANQYSEKYFDELLKKTAFTKSANYAHEREIRTCFFLHTASVGLIPVKQDPKNIDLKPILQLLN
jgi:hypothetical protein